MGYLGEFEQLILFSVVQLGDDAYGVAIRETIEERTGRVVSSGAIMPARAPASMVILQTVIRSSMLRLRIASPVYSMT